jgi:hypothetical protein
MQAGAPGRSSHPPPMTFQFQCLSLPFSGGPALLGSLGAQCDNESLAEASSTVARSTHYKATGVEVRRRNLEISEDLLRSLPGRNIYSPINGLVAHKKWKMLYSLSRMSIPTRTQIWTQPIANLEVWMKKRAELKLAISCRCYCRLLVWRANRSTEEEIYQPVGTFHLPPAVLKQDEIGWYHLLEDRISMLVRKTTVRHRYFLMIIEDHDFAG